MTDDDQKRYSDKAGHDGDGDVTPYRESTSEDPTPPALVEPVPAAPAVGEPGAYEPGVYEPGAYEPGAYEPGVDESSARESSARETGARETGARETGARETGADASRHDAEAAKHADDRTADADREETVEAAHAASATVVMPEQVAAAAPVAAATPQVVYVSKPVPPTKKGNRGFGVLLAVLATVVFAALFTLVVMTGLMIWSGTNTFAFVTRPSFMVPIILFLVAFVLLVLVANRASWWAYIVGSIFVGAIVYFGTIGVVLLLNGVVADTPTEALNRFSRALADPFLIIAALLARELTMWTGLAIAARGRKVKARNVEARAEFDRGVENDRAGHTPAPAA